LSDLHDLGVDSYVFKPAEVDFPVYKAH